MHALLTQLRQDHVHYSRLLNLLEIQLISLEAGKPADFHLMRDIVLSPPVYSVAGPLTRSPGSPYRGAYPVNPYIFYGNIFVLQEMPEIRQKLFGKWGKSGGSERFSL